MRVRMTTLSATPRDVLEAGKVYDLPTERAQRLIAARAAVPADKDPAEQLSQQAPKKRTSKRRKS